MTQIAEGLGLSATGAGHWVRQLVRNGEVVRLDPQPPERSYRYTAP